MIAVIELWRQPVSDHHTHQPARSAGEKRAFAAHRRAIVTARRTQIGRARAAVRAQLADSFRHRQDISSALVRLRLGLRDFRGEVRTRLREIASAAAHRRGGQKGQDSDAAGD